MTFQAALWYFVLAFAVASTGQQPQTESQNPPKQPPEAVTGDDTVTDSLPPLIDEKAAAALKRMSDHLAGLRAFRFEAEIDFDEVSSDGQKIQLSRQLDVSVARPDKIRFEMRGDSIQRTAWYDGRQVSILRADKRVCCQVAAPENIDKMLVHMADNYDLSTPCADFLYSDVGTGLVMDVRTGRYLGVHRVGEHRCHHLAFTQDALDWQVWIDDSEKPLPRKFVITYKTVEQSPQYSIRFTRWDTEAKFPDQHFAFAFPPDMARVELLRVAATNTAPESEGRQREQTEK